MSFERRHGAPTRGHSSPNEPGEPRGFFKLIGDVIIFVIRLVRNWRSPQPKRRQHKPAPIPKRKVSRRTARGFAWDVGREEGDLRIPEEPTPTRPLPRALSRERRVVRVVFWRLGRPVARFHRRTSTRNLLFIYLGPLGAVSLVAMTMFIIHGFAKPASGASSLPPEAAKRLLLTQIASQLETNQTDAAWHNIEKLRANSPNDAVVENLAGTVFAMRKDYDQARAAFQKAMTLEPNGVAARNNLAEIEFSTKRYAEAEQLYRALLPQTPRKALTAYHIYLCLLLQHRDTEAKELFALIPSPPSTSSPAWFYAQAGRAFIEGNKAEGQQYLENGRLYYPELSKLYEPSLKQLGFTK